MLTRPGAPGLMVNPLESLKLAEIQLDTLLHVANERGALDATAGQVGRVLEEVLERASVTYTRSASSVSLSNDSTCRVHGAQQAGDTD
jgi:hypothetical protein